MVNIVSISQDDNGIRCINIYVTVPGNQGYISISIYGDSYYNKGWQYLPGLSLNNLNFSTLYIIGIDLSATNLTNTNFSNTDITNVNFTGATLSGIISGGISGTGYTLPTGWKLINGYLLGPGSNLTNANLANINLSGLDLSNCILTGVRSGGITGTPQGLPTGWQIMNGYLVGPGANLTGATLTGSLYNTTDLSGAILTGVTSSFITGTPLRFPVDNGWKIAGGYIIGPNVNLTNANLSGLILSDINLSEVNLTNANLLGVISSGITGTPFRFPTDTGWTIISGRLVGQGVDLSGITLNNINISNINLTNATLTGLISSGITGSNYILPTSWKLINGYLIGPGANLNKVNLSNLNLSQCTLTGVSSGGIIGTPPSALPSGWQFVTGGYLIGPGANLTNAILTGITIEPTTDLTGAILTNVTSNNIIGSLQASTGMLISGGHIIGPGVNLSGVILSNINLSGINLTNIILTNTTLDNTNFTNANLTGVISGNVTGIPSNFPSAIGWSMISGYIVGPGVNLTNADLSNTIISGLNLTGANLTSAKLSNTSLTNIDITNTIFTSATLTGLISKNITGIPSNLPGWTIIKGYIVGPSVNLTGANLTGANLTSINLTGANLTNVILTNTTLTNTIFTNATLTGVISGGLKGTPSTFPDSPTTPSVWKIIGGYIIGPGVSLNSANLSELNLSTCTLTGVSSGAIIGIPILPSTFTISNGYIIGPGVILTGSILKNVSLQNIDLTGTNLTNADLTGATLQNVTIDYNTIFTGAILTGLVTSGIINNAVQAKMIYTFVYAAAAVPNATRIDSFTNNYGTYYIYSNNSSTIGSKNDPKLSFNVIDYVITIDDNWTIPRSVLYTTALTNVNSSQINIGGRYINVTSCTQTPINLLPTGYSIVNGYIIGPNLNLSNVNLDNKDLSNIDLTGANLTNAILTNTTLTSTIFTSATLTGVISKNITYTTLPTFPDSPTTPSVWKIIGGYLIGPGVSLNSANLSGLSLSSCTLTGVSSGSIIYTTTTSLPLPTYWKLLNGYLVGAGANLTGANIVGSLSGIDLSSAILTGAKSSNITDTPNKFPDGSTTSTTTWKVIGKYLIGPGVSLNSADLTGLNLSTCTLTGVSSGGITGTGYTLPTGWQIMNGYLVGPDANLKGANLSGAFSSNTDLRGANLTGVVSNTITGTPRYFPNATGWGIVNGYLVGPGVNLTGVNFTNKNLSNIDLTGANLTNVIFVNTTLTNTIFTNATLIGVTSSGITTQPFQSSWKIIGGYIVGPGVNLTSVDFSNKDLSNIDLTSSNFTNATLTGVTSGGIKGTPSVLPTGWQMMNGYLVGPGANLTGATLIGTFVATTDLTGAILTGMVSNYITSTPIPILPTGTSIINGMIFGPSVNLTNANLSNLSLTSVNLSGATLTNAIITNTNFTDCILTGVISGGITGTGYTLPTGYQLMNGYLVGRGANLTGATLTGAFNSTTDLTGAILTGVISNTITGTPLHFPSTTGWGITNGSIVGPGVNLTGVNLTGSNLTNIDLRGATLTGVVSGNISGNPLGCSIRNDYIIAPGVNLTNANLHGTNLNGLDLSTCTLTGVISGGITNTPVTPIGWQMMNGYLVGPNANLTNANLRGSFNNTTDLTGAILSGVVSSTITGTPLHFPATTGWGITNGYIVGPGVNLTGANLSNANLTGINLTGATIVNITQNGTITGPPLSLSVGWVFANGYLIGPGIDLTGANLSGIKISNVNLSGTKLLNANVTGAAISNISGSPSSYPVITGFKIINGYLVGTGVDLTNANLYGADISTVNLTGVTFTGVISGNVTGTPTGFTINGCVANGYIIAPGVNLTNANLSGINLFGIDITGIIFTGANLIGVTSGGITTTPRAFPDSTVNWNIVNGYLIGPGVDLTGARLYGNMFKYIDFSNINFTNCDLSYCSFNYVKMSGTILSGANLTNTETNNITGIPNSFPANTGWVMCNGSIVGPGVWLNSSFISNIDISKIDLSGTTIYKVQTSNLVNQPINYPTSKGWGMINGYLVGPNMDLSNANLAGGNLTNISLANCILSNISSGGLIGTPTELPENWYVIKGYLVGPEANLAGADLSGANLSNIDLSNSNMVGIILTNAILVNTKLTNAITKLSLNYNDILLKKQLGMMETKPNLNTSLFRNDISGFNRPKILNSQLYRQTIPNVVPNDFQTQSPLYIDINGRGGFTGTLTSNIGICYKSLSYPWIQKINTLSLTTIVSGISYTSPLLKQSIPYNYDPNKSYAYTVTIGSGNGLSNYPANTISNSNIVDSKYYIVDNDAGTLLFLNQDWNEETNGLPIITFYRYNGLTGITNTVTESLGTISGNVSIRFGNLQTRFFNGIVGGDIKNITFSEGIQYGVYTIYLTTASPIPLHVIINTISYSIVLYSYLCINVQYIDNYYNISVNNYSTIPVSVTLLNKLLADGITKGNISQLIDTMDLSTIPPGVIQSFIQNLTPAQLANPILIYPELPDITITNIVNNLTIPQLQSFNNSLFDITNSLGQSIIQLLTPFQVSNLTIQQIQAFGQTEISSLSNVFLDVVLVKTTTSILNLLTPTQIGYLSLKQIQSFGQSQITALTNSQLAVTFSPNNLSLLQLLNPIQLSYLSKIQIQNMTTILFGQVLTTLTLTQINNIQQAQLQSFPTSYFSIPNFLELLTQTQFTWLSEAQFKAIPGYIFGLLSNATNLSIIQNLSTSSYSWFTKPQIQTMDNIYLLPQNGQIFYENGNIQNVSITKSGTVDITTTYVLSVTGLQKSYTQPVEAYNIVIDNIYFKINTLVLNTSQVPTSITFTTSLGSHLNININITNNTSFAMYCPGSIILSLFPTQQVSYFSYTQIQNFTSMEIENLTIDHLNTNIDDQTLSSNKIIQLLSPTQFMYLIPSQLQNFTNTMFNLQIYYNREPVIRQLSYLVGYFTALQIKNLTENEIKLLSISQFETIINYDIYNSSLIELLSTIQLGYISQTQLHEFDNMTMSLLSNIIPIVPNSLLQMLSPVQVSIITIDGWMSLSASQIVCLNPSQLVLLPVSFLITEVNPENKDLSIKFFNANQLSYLNIYDLTIVAGYLESSQVSSISFSSITDVKRGGTDNRLLSLSLTGSLYKILSNISRSAISGLTNAQLCSPSSTDINPITFIYESLTLNQIMGLTYSQLISKHPYFNNQYSILAFLSYQQIININPSLIGNFTNSELNSLLYGLPSQFSGLTDEQLAFFIWNYDRESIVNTTVLKNIMQSGGLPASYDVSLKTYYNEVRRLQNPNQVLPIVSVEYDNIYLNGLSSRYIYYYNDGTRQFGIAGLGIIDYLRKHLNIPKKELVPMYGTIIPQQFLPFYTLLNPAQISNIKIDTNTTYSSIVNGTKGNSSITLSTPNPNIIAGMMVIGPSLTSLASTTIPYNGTTKLIINNQSSSYYTSSICNGTYGNPTLTLSNANYAISIGMSVVGNNIQPNTTIININTTNTIITLSTNILSTFSNTIITFLLNKNSITTTNSDCTSTGSNTLSLSTPNNNITIGMCVYESSYIPTNTYVKNITTNQTTNTTTIQLSNNTKTSFSNENIIFSYMQIGMTINSTTFTYILNGISGSNVLTLYTSDISLVIGMSVSGLTIPPNTIITNINETNTNTIITLNTTLDKTFTNTSVTFSFTPANTIITSIDKSGTFITLNNTINTTFSNTSLGLSNIPTTYTLNNVNGSITNNTSTLTLSAANTSLTIGMNVSGLTIPLNTIITAIDSTNTIITLNTTLVSTFTSSSVIFSSIPTTCLITCSTKYDDSYHTNSITINNQQTIQNGMIVTSNSYKYKASSSGLYMLTIFNPNQDSFIIPGMAIIDDTGIIPLNTIVLSINPTTDGSTNVIIVNNLLISFKEMSLVFSIVPANTTVLSTNNNNTLTLSNSLYTSFSDIPFTFSIIPSNMVVSFTGTANMTTNTKQIVLTQTTLGVQPGMSITTTSYTTITYGTIGTNQLFLYNQNSSISIGMNVTGPNIDSNTFITAIDNTGKILTLTTNLLHTFSDITLTFSYIPQNTIVTSVNNTNGIITINNTLFATVSTITLTFSSISIIGVIDNTVIESINTTGTLTTLTLTNKLTLDLSNVSLTFVKNQFLLDPTQLSLLTNTQVGGLTINQLESFAYGTTTKCIDILGTIRDINNVPFTSYCTQAIPHFSSFELSGIDVNGKLTGKPIIQYIVKEVMSYLTLKQISELDINTINSLSSNQVGGLTYNQLNTTIIANNKLLIEVLTLNQLLTGITPLQNQFIIQDSILLNRFIIKLGGNTTSSNIGNITTTNQAYGTYVSNQVNIQYSQKFDKDGQDQNSIAMAGLINTANRNSNSKVLANFQQNNTATSISNDNNIISGFNASSSYALNTLKYGKELLDFTSTYGLPQTKYIKRVEKDIQIPKEEKYNYYAVKKIATTEVAYTGPAVYTTDVTQAEKFAQSNKTTLQVSNIEVKDPVTGKISQQKQWNVTPKTVVNGNSIINTGKLDKKINENNVNNAFDFTPSLNYPMIVNVGGMLISAYGSSIFGISPHVGTESRKAFENRDNLNYDKDGLAVVKTSKAGDNSTSKAFAVFNGIMTAYNAYNTALNIYDTYQQIDKLINPPPPVIATATQVFNNLFGFTFPTQPGFSIGNNKIIVLVTGNTTFISDNELLETDINFVSDRNYNSRPVDKIGYQSILIIPNCMSLITNMTFNNVYSFKNSNGDQLTYKLYL